MLNCTLLLLSKYLLKCVYYTIKQSINKQKIVLYLYNLEKKTSEITNPTQAQKQL